MDIKKDYLDFLSNRTNETVIESDLVWRLTTPFVDYQNDSIEVYITKQEDGNFKITDDSATLGDLSFSGMDIFSSPIRKEKFYNIISTFQLKLLEQELSIVVPEKRISQGIFYISQAISKISSLILLQKQNIKNIFLEDVKALFRDNNIPFEAGHKVIGKSGMLTEFDMFLPRFKDATPTLLKAANKLRPAEAKEIIFEWEDTNGARPLGSQYIVLYNDEFGVQKKTIDAVKEYGINPVPYSYLKRNIKELVH